LLLMSATVLAGCASAPPDVADPETVATTRQREPSRRESSAQLAPSGPFTLELVADFNIPTGTSFGGIPEVDFGGLSGLFFDPDRAEIVAISDSRANNRYFTLEMELDGDSITLTPKAVTRLEDGSPPEASGAAGAGASTGGASATRRVFDPESIARAPDGNLFVSAEGFVAREPRIAPTISEFQPDGQFVRFLPVPDKYVPEAEGPQTKGIVNNLGFESLTVSPDGSRVFTATEAALVQDGTPSSANEGSPARILEIEIAEGAAESVKEYVYLVEPLTLPDDFEPIAGENGLVELLALGNDELLALERNFVRGGTREAPRRRNVIRIFRVTLQGATDVADIFSLADATDVVPVAKELVIDFDEITPGLSPEYPELDNFEGLSWGPVLPDGSPSLIVVSDNNFNPWQRTSFLLFRVRTD
jgi:3-phytase/alkaline phosphatase D